MEWFNYELEQFSFIYIFISAAVKSDLAEKFWTSFYLFE